MNSARDYVELFIGEDAFIRAVLDGKVHAVQRSKKIVYSLAQTGTGPARKALITTFCNLHHLPFSNSDGHVVALPAPQVPRDVYTSRSRLILPVPRTWFFLQTGEWLRSERPPDGLKIIVKATYEAASIGLSKDCVRFSDSNLEEFAFAHSPSLR
jgi:D-alanine-D-alanine ligase